MTLAIGSSAPAFDLQGTDGEHHSLASYDDADVLVLVQSCNHCPYVLAWEDRLMTVADDYRDRGVRVVALNSNDASRYPEDDYERMVAHAAEKSFNFDYLHDPEQTLAQALGSVRTPEVFLFDRDRRLVYHGAIDDSRDDSAVERRHLRAALDELLAGRTPEVDDTPVVGCTVKWRQ